MKKYCLPIFLFALLFMLTACTEGTSDQPLTNDNTNSTTNYSDNNNNARKKDNIVIGFEADAGTLIANTDVNYVTDAQIRNIYDPLITRDGTTGKYMPSLAESWESLDELTWRLTLKEGVKFHNGADFNAEAVKFSIDYILDESNGSFYRSRWTKIEEVVVISPTEVEIHTSEPFPGLIERITGDLLVLEPGYVQAVGKDEAAKKPVGTGPYKFVDWSRDNYLKLESFEEYWAGAPSIKNVEFRYIPEFSARLSAFLSGEIDLFKNIPVDSVSSVEKDANSKIAEVASSRINYLALNTFYDGPLQDPKVRQAINYAVDVDELISAILNGHASKMTGPLSKINSSYVETKDYSYDPEKAIALLQEAGYTPQELTLTLDTPNGRYPMDSQVAQAVASQLQRIGIKVDVQVNEWGTHLEKIRNREMKDIFILGWGPAFEPDSTIFDLFTENAPYSGFSNPAIEEKIFEVAKIFDDTQRQELYSEIQHLLVETAAWVPLWQQGDLYAVRDNLNFVPRVDEEFKIVDMSWQ